MKVTALILALFTAAFSAYAWNAAGHHIISAMVYDRLTPAARARADDLIRRHPDYETHFLKGVLESASPAVRARSAFINASVWPDEIRNDPRFYNEERADVTPTPLLPGFPDMGRHVTWHYIDIPFSQDGTPLQDPPFPNAVTEIERLMVAVGKPVGDAENPVYALPWLLHLVEDLHNPLHAVTRFSRDNPDGDRGGNLIFVQPGNNLHAFWDGLAAPDPATPAAVDALASQLRRTGTKRPISAGPAIWAQEGVEIAKKSVYSFGLSSGTKDRPIMLSTKYQNVAKQLYREEFAAAAARLSNLLNRELK